MKKEMEKSNTRREKEVTVHTQTHSHRHTPTDVCVCMCVLVSAYLLNCWTSLSLLLLLLFPTPFLISFSPPTHPFLLLGMDQRWIFFFFFPPFSSISFVILVPFLFLFSTYRPFRYFSI